MSKKGKKTLTPEEEANLGITELIQGGTKKDIKKAITLDLDGKSVKLSRVTTKNTKQKMGTTLVYNDDGTYEVRGGEKSAVSAAKKIAEMLEANPDMDEADKKKYSALQTKIEAYAAQKKREREDKLYEKAQREMAEEAKKSPLQRINEKTAEFKARMDKIEGQVAPEKKKTVEELAHEQTLKNIKLAETKLAQLEDRKSRLSKTATDYDTKVAALDKQINQQLVRLDGVKKFAADKGITVEETEKLLGDIAVTDDHEKEVGLRGRKEELDKKLEAKREAEKNQGKKETDKKKEELDALRDERKAYYEKQKAALEERRITLKQVANGELAGLNQEINDFKFVRDKDNNIIARSQEEYDALYEKMEATKAKWESDLDAIKAGIAECEAQLAVIEKEVQEASKGEQPAGKGEGEQPAGKGEGEQPAGKGEDEQPAGKGEGEQPAGKGEGEQPAGKGEDLPAIDGKDVYGYLGIGDRYRVKLTAFAQSEGISENQIGFLTKIRLFLPSGKYRTMAENGISNNTIGLDESVMKAYKEDLEARQAQDVDISQEEPAKKKEEPAKKPNGLEPLTGEDKAKFEKGEEKVIKSAQEPKTQEPPAKKEEELTI